MTDDKGGSNGPVNDEESKEKDFRYGDNVKTFEKEWQNLMLLASDEKLSKLKKMSINGGFPQFRSVSWSLMLGDLVGSSDSWIEQKQKNRDKYEKVKKLYMFDPHNDYEQQNDDPLSQLEDSVWNQFFRDSELKNLIKQDVMRTNPSIDFFKEDDIQEIMINILFCFARENPSICYRQGMHEVLGPIVLVIYSDAVCVDHIKEETSIELDRILINVLDSKYLEADSYNIFCCIMKSLELFYRINDMSISESGQLVNAKKMGENNQVEVVREDKKSYGIEVVHQLNIIRDEIFAKQDKILHNHLQKLEIPLALFGIRWLRLLFGREFNIHDLFVLWDAIFGVGENLALTYYIVVAMLIQMRDRLLSRDYTDCLTLLMRYPRTDINIIIQHALHMKSPENFKCPADLFTRSTSNNSENLHKSANDNNIETYSSLNLPFGKYFPPSAVAASAITLAIKHTPIEIQPESSNFRRYDSENGIVDGFLLDDPKIMKMELQDAHNIMNLTRMKLFQYVKILRKCYPEHHSDELNQTIDGIEELCALLKLKKQYSMSTDAEEIPPIDPAFEPEDSDTLKGNMYEPRSFPITKLPQTNNYELPNNRLHKRTNMILKKNAKKEFEMNLIRSSSIGWSDCGYPPTKIAVASTSTEENDCDDDGESEDYTTNDMNNFKKFVN